MRGIDVVYFAYLWMIGRCIVWFCLEADPWRASEYVALGLFLLFMVALLYEFEKLLDTQRKLLDAQERRIDRLEREPQ